VNLKVFLLAFFGDMCNETAEKYVNRMSDSSKRVHIVAKFNKQTKQKKNSKAEGEKERNSQQ
jgi:hypothetical protein